MTDAARLKSTVYVGGLDSAVSERTLMDAFIPFGEVVDVSLPKPEIPSSADPHRGFGYVEFELAQDAKEAIDNMDQSELFGRVIRVAQAKPQKEAGEGLGSKTAIWEQEAWLAKHVANEGDAASTGVDGDGNQSDKDPTTILKDLDFAGPSQVKD